MATSGIPEDEAKQLAAQLGKTLKEGERIVGPTRRPDGTLRKPIRIRAGYVPQEEVAIYQSKGALLKKELESQVGPPGYEPEVDAKSKSKSVKRNERKKEKRNQAALERDRNSDQTTNDNVKEELLHAEDPGQKVEFLESVTSQMNEVALSTNTTPDASSQLLEDSTPPSNSIDINKKIRALKKKIRLTEAQLEKASQDAKKPELLDKVTKLEGWREELKLLESQKEQLASL